MIAQDRSGAIILFVYLLICLSQLRMRPTIPPERLKVKMWLYPVLTILIAAAIVGVLVSMFVREGTRSQLILSLLAWAVELVAYALQRRAIGDAHLTESGIAAEARADKWMHEHGAAKHGTDPPSAPGRATRRHTCSQELLAARGATGSPHLRLA